MKSFAAAAIGLISNAFANVTVLPPPASASGDNVAYTTFASEIQSQGAANGQKIWVGLPQFILDAPEPILIDSYVSKTIKKLQESGFEGENILIAGHSLGGVMSQRYAKGKSD